MVWEQALTILLVSLIFNGMYLTTCTTESSDMQQMDHSTTIGPDFETTMTDSTMTDTDYQSTSQYTEVESTTFGEENPTIYPKYVQEITTANIFPKDLPSEKNIPEMVTVLPMPMPISMIMPATFINTLDRMKSVTNEIYSNPKIDPHDAAQIPSPSIHLTPPKFSSSVLLNSLKKTNDLNNKTKE